MSETPAEKAEARAIRRRWLTIGELVAVAGVVIAGLSLWLSWSNDRAGKAERKAEKVAEASKAARVTFTARADGDALVLSDPEHRIASIDLSYPRVLGIASQSALVEPRIEADPLRKPLLAATDKAPDTITGGVPVLVTATLADGDGSVDRAIYDVMFETGGTTLGIGGRTLKLKGVLLRERVGSGDATARLDTRWADEARRLATLKN